MDMCSRCRLVFSLAVLFSAVTFVASVEYPVGGEATFRCDIKEANVEDFVYMLRRRDPDSESFVNIINYVNGKTGQLEYEPLAGRVSFEPPVLRIWNLTLQDSGRYTCEVLLGKSKTNHVDIEVYAVPDSSVHQIAIPTVNQSSGLYKAAVCRARGGKPPPAVQWINTITGETQISDNVEVVLDDGTYDVTSALKLRPGVTGRHENSTEPLLQQDLTAGYTCIVAHKGFPHGQWIGRVDVDRLCSPRVEIVVNGNRLTCNAVGNPMPVISWKRPNGSVEVGAKHIYVDQSAPAESSGRYVCRAENDIGPGATAVVDIKRSKSLPTILSTGLRYDTAIPVGVTDYDMDCAAELEAAKLKNRAKATFEWTRDGVRIRADSARFKTFSITTRLSDEKMVVKSTLRVSEVTRSIDGSIFACRLDLLNPISGYVRSVERTIRVVVHYPPVPGSVSISVHPFPAVYERRDVTLKCNAVAAPASSYRWFFEGHELTPGPVLTLRNVSRYQAGSYKCVAFNYVPGSVTAEANVTVHYPPGPVTVTRSRDTLECSAEGSGFPAPLYAWIFPNGSRTSGNTSVLRVGSLVESRPASYVCVSRNALGEVNATYVLLAPESAQIGSLSVGEFAVVIAALFLVALIVAALCVLKRRDSRKKPTGTKTQRNGLPSSFAAGMKPMNLSRSTNGSASSLDEPRNVFDNGEGNSFRRKGSVDGGFRQNSPAHVNQARTRDDPAQESCPSDSSKIAYAEATSNGLNAAHNQPQLSTFAPHTAENGTPRNYYTIMNSARRLQQETKLTRAYSEDFKAGHLGIKAQPEQRGISYDQARPNPFQTNSRVASPCRFTLRDPPANGKSYLSRDDSTASLLRCADLSNRNEFGSVRNELAGDDSNEDVKFPPLPDCVKYAQPARCQSAGPARGTPSMVELPDRSYLYQPHRFGLASAGSDADTGSDVTKSGTDTAGKRLQSLTLV